MCRTEKPLGHHFAAGLRMLFCTRSAEIGSHRRAGAFPCSGNRAFTALRSAAGRRYRGIRLACRDPMRLRLDGASVWVASGNRSTSVGVSCDNGQAGSADFVVAVPGRISRRYTGNLQISARPHELIIIVAMEMEIAVASIVAAESPPDAPIEALKAQAVATR